MNARSLTRTATLVAMTMAMAAVAPTADAAPRAGMRDLTARTVNCRAVATYGMSAWVAPMAVVVTSPVAWSQWNAEQVNAGRALAEEALPADVDWAKEVVVVLSVGELSAPLAVELTGAQKKNAQTLLNLRVLTGQGGNCPALVLALDRANCKNVRLVVSDYELAGVPLAPETYAGTATLASAGNDDGLTVVTSWGAIKAEYR
jgi:hypothetical protein